MEDIVVRSVATADAARAGAMLDPAELEKSLRRPRSLINFLLNSAVTLLTLSALIPLFSVVYMLLAKGSQRLNWTAFKSLPPAAGDDGGGFGNALAGTLMMVAIAALLSVPFGILTAVFLAEIGPKTKLAYVVRFGAKMLSGFPSVLAGVFAYGAVVLVTGHFSAYAGGVALALLMLPTVMLTAEDAIKMVPARLREAAIGMGATPTQTIWHVTLPTAIPGVLTGVMLAVARAAGETAPLLMTALSSSRWPIANGRLALNQATASLAYLIYDFSASPYDNMQELAWAAALVLVLFVLTTNLIGQSLSRRQSL